MDRWKNDEAKKERGTESRDIDRKDSRDMYSRALMLSNPGLTNM